MNRYGTLVTLLPMLMCGSFLPNVHELEGADLLKEYELIKQKKSNLSASRRRRITYIVESKQ